MPYRSEGGVKFTNHWTRSPLASISTSCQVCHRESEEKLRANVFDRQDKVKDLMLLVEDSLVRAHLEAEFAGSGGATKKSLKPILRLIRHAQWRWDWVAAAIGVGFHSPAEALRTLGTSIQKSQEAHAELVRLLAGFGVLAPYPLPDVSTKEKAQRYVGSDMTKLVVGKAPFLRGVLPEWDKDARRREEHYAK
jgi:nitrite reductase (cytochrome c-552)